MITYYDNIQSHSNKNIEISKFLTLLTNPKIKILTDNCRKYDKKTQKEELNKQKFKLPLIVASGLFKENTIRSIENLTEHTNIIILDYDEISNTEDVFNKLKENPFIHLIFRSPSGTGLKVFIKVHLDTIVSLSADMSETETNEQYNNANKLYYEMIGELFYKYINILPDEQAKDITRCCYISYDDKYYFNRNSQQFKITVKEAETYNKKKLKSVNKSVNKTTAVGSQEVIFMNEIIDFLVDKKIDISSEYNNWVYLAHLCKKLYEPNIALVKFHQISQFSPSYKADETTKKFKNILNILIDKPTSFSYLNSVLKENSVNFIPKQSKNLFKETLGKEDVQRIMDYENWNIEYCKIKKIHYIHIPNLNHENYPSNKIPLELSGKKGDSIIWQYFIKNYSLNLTDKDIYNNIYSYKSTKVNFIQDKFNQIKTDDNTEYEKFFNLIESEIEIKSGMTRWFIGCFDNWLKDEGRKYDEMLILQDPIGNIGKTDLINNYLFKIFKWNDKSYVCSNGNFKISNKDDFMNDAQNLVCYKPEISGRILKDSDNVKDYISRRETNIRVPYGRNNEEFNSYTSFIGDTNDEGFLSAEQNRRRFIVIKLIKLKFQNIKFDWEKFWGYLYHLYFDLGKRYKDYPTIDNIDFVELNTDLSLLDEVITKNDELSFTTTEIISMISTERTNFKVTKNEMIKYLRMRGYEYRNKWIIMEKRVKKGWNTQLDLNLSNQYKLNSGDTNELF